MRTSPLRIAPFASLTSSLLVSVLACSASAPEPTPGATGTTESALAPNCAWVARATGDFEIADDPEFAPNLLLVSNVGQGAGNFPVEIRQLSGLDGSVLAGPINVAENYSGNSATNGPEFARLPAGGAVRMGVLYRSPRGVSAAWRVTNPPSWNAFTSKLDGSAMALPRVGPPLLDSTPGDAYPGGGFPDDLFGYNAFGGTCPGLCYGRVDGAAGSMSPIHQIAFAVDGLVGPASTAHATVGDDVLLSACRFDATCAQTTCPADLACIAACAGDFACLQGCNTACLTTCATTECGVYRGRIDGAGGMVPIATPTPSPCSGGTRTLTHFEAVACTNHGAIRETLRSGKTPGSSSVFTFVKDGGDVLVLKEGSPWSQRLVGAGQNAEHFRTVGGARGVLELYFQVRTGPNAGSYRITVDDNGPAPTAALSAPFTTDTYGVELVYLPQRASGAGFTYFAVRPRPALAQDWIVRCEL